MLINGGAAIALLAFLGNLDADRLVSTKPYSAFALASFAILGGRARQSVNTLLSFSRSVDLCSRLVDLLPIEMPAKL